MTELYPAVDIRGGHAVRLVQGDFDREHVYGDPVELARQFASAGAHWLHVVDLDGALRGRAANRAAVLAVADAVDVPVQAGGGVRTEADVDELLDGGVARVVMGTAALEDGELVARMSKRHPGAVAAGLDYRHRPDGGNELATRGWEKGSGSSLHTVLAALEDAGVAAVVVTAIDRDGTLAGPDLPGLESVLAATAIPVIASGGVGGVADVAALASLCVPGSASDAAGAAGRRLAGIITGKALVDGRLTVEEGVDACTPSG